MNERPNQAMQPTAGRRTASLYLYENAFIASPARSHERSLILLIDSNFPILGLRPLLRMSMSHCSSRLHSLMLLVHPSGFPSMSRLGSPLHSR
jgi:hypothetical protein